ncbi:MAG: SRPBCC family protein [Actinomycetota bacterium]
MSIDVTAEAAIARPHEEVAGYALDYRNDPVWIGGIREAELVDDGPFGAGSRVRRVAKFLGRRIEYVLQVAELEPGRRIVMRSVKSPFPMLVTYEFVDAPGGTLARIRVQGDPSGSYRLSDRLMAPMVRRSIGKDVRRLKELLEARRDG